ncbi:putative transcription factor interactor and regulator CCHC(Zn) family protein [Tanacetum coccineum]|uniref:Transcription factor interactor and regulator CCHC(Zn) family protein n=1 Tax=Tanacetum coccineum TaxID=301880 RepID=A0ABQ5GPM0_9ASTR
MPGDDSSNSFDSSINISNISDKSDLPDLKFGDPLFLHPNDTSPTPLINFKLIGTDNYNMWSCTMKFALRNKSKLGFIDGTCKRKSDDHVLANQWDLCNSVVITWILNSVSAELYASQIYSKTAFDMWTNLKDTYRKVDGYVIFNLYKSINPLNQNGSSLSEYYHNLNTLWKQFDAMISLPTCTCEAAEHYENHANQIKLMHFLMGLDDVYQPIRSNILTREPLPLVKTAFVVASGEESYRNVTSSSSTSKTPSATAFAAKGFDNKNLIKRGNKNNKHHVKRGPNPNLKCTNCDKVSHTIERCFDLIEYPPNYKKQRNQNANKHTVNNAISNPNPSTASAVSFSNEQMLKLLSLIDENSVSYSVANMAVGHPNDTKAKIVKIKDLKLNDFVTMFNVLVVPEYTDLKRNMIVGTGDMNGGLYLFDAKWGLPLYLLSDCNLTAVYLINRLPSSILAGQSPYSYVYGRNPTLSHLRVYGCLCFATLLNNHDKFNSRDVKFYETVFPLKIKQNETGIETGVSKDLNHINFFNYGNLYDEQPNPKRTNDEGRVPSNNDCTESNPVNEGNDDSDATFIEDNAHPEGNTKSINQYDESEGESNHPIEREKRIDLTKNINYDDVAEPVRRSSR